MKRSVVGNIKKNWIESIMYDELNTVSSIDYELRRSSLCNVIANE